MAFARFSWANAYSRIFHEYTRILQQYRTMDLHRAFNFDDCYQFPDRHYPVLLQFHIVVG